MCSFLVCIGKINFSYKKIAEIFIIKIEKQISDRILCSANCINDQFKFKTKIV